MKKKEIQTIDREIRKEAEKICEKETKREILS